MVDNSTDNSVNAINERFQQYETVIESIFSRINNVISFLEDLVAQTAILQASQTAALQASQPVQTSQSATISPENSQGGAKSAEVLALISSSISRELAKKAYSMPEEQRLIGVENFTQWKQALSIIFRALGIAEFTNNPTIIQGLSDADQAIALIIIRDSYTSST